MSLSSDECASSLFGRIESVSIQFWILLVGSVYLFISKLNDWHVFYQMKLILEYLFFPVPLIEVEMSTAETDDDGIKTKPSNASKLELQDPQKPGFIQCFDPSTRQFLGEVKAMNAHDIHELCLKAADAQKEWVKTSFAQRRKVLRTIQKYILHHIDDICRVCARDSGKAMVDAFMGEVLTTCEKIRWMNMNGELWLQPESRSTGPMMVHKREFVASETC